MAYSLDLRQCVVDAINQEKETQQATATSIDRNQLRVVVKANPSAYLDEVECSYGRAPKGERVHEEMSGQRTERTSIITGLQDGKPVAPWCFKGYCNTEVVLS